MTGINASQASGGLGKLLGGISSLFGINGSYESGAEQMALVLLTFPATWS